MLRMILGAKRRLIDLPESEDMNENRNNPEENLEEEDINQEEEDFSLLEPWQDFVRRTTRIIEGISIEKGFEDWITIWRRKQWKFAGELVTTQMHKWSYKAMSWRPDWHGEAEGYRSQGRPNKKWEDDITRNLTKIY